MAAADRDRTGRRGGLSLRLRLTLSYAILVVLAGAALIIVTLLMLRFIPDGNLITVQGGVAPRRSDLIDVFVRYAVWALALLAALGLGGGWLLAGRMLAPLRRMTEIANRTRDGALEHRIALRGPRDELTDLADAFDAMLDRVQGSIERQRRFAANASHELRTPLAVTRTMLEVAASTSATPADERLLQRLAEMNERSISMTEALLDLARAEETSRPFEQVDLAALASVVIEDSADLASSSGVTMTSALEPAVVLGDLPLLELLLTNIIRNAILHNHRDGEVHIVVASGEGVGAGLRVVNTGPILDPATLATLREPFVRGAGRTRARDGDTHVGAGLGLAIVAAVARRHSARLELHALAHGGLSAGVQFSPHRR